MTAVTPHSVDTPLQFLSYIDLARWAVAPLHLQFVVRTLSNIPFTQLLVDTLSSKVSQFFKITFKYNYLKPVMMKYYNFHVFRMNFKNPIK